jgi:Tol biopolymer transport system component
MSLVAGTKLGPYEILAPLGAGGMGEVYRAQDTRLDRTVAIKVLPCEFAASTEARQRFEREARAVSSLNHPHICALYDIGRQDETDFLVMEYLEGETLADRLAKGALPLEEALRLAIQVAGALDAAHRHGVVHRDLKPGNVMLTRSGGKLLDFGLAKMGQAAPPVEGSLAATLTRPLTAHGTILGTFQYMAPEQLEGQEADARTDIFAFGAVLYEMLTGRRAFEGRSQASLISAIMSSDPPPISTLQPASKGTPPSALDHVVRTCLKKNPEDRFQTAHDVMLQLQWVTEMEPGHAPRSERPRTWPHWLLSAGLFIAALAFAVAWYRRPAVEVHSVRFTLDPPDNASFPPYPGFVAVSPDGLRIAFVAAGEGKNLLWVRALDTLAVRSLPGSEGASSPFWSPDSRFIGFFADRKLKKIEASGGPAIILCDAASPAPFGLGGAWNQDGTIVFAQTGGLFHRVSAAGGVAVPLASIAAGERQQVSFPSFLPGGRHLVHTGTVDVSGSMGTFITLLDTKESRRLFQPSRGAAYSHRHLLFLRAGNLMAMPFDVKRLEPAGSAVPLAEMVDTFSVSENGVLVYRTGSVGGFGKQLTWYDRSGKQKQPLGKMAGYFTLRLSPDEKRLAVQIYDTQTLGDIWVFDLTRAIPTRLTFDPSNDHHPVWSPDGIRIVWASNRPARSGSGGTSNLYIKNSGGTGDDELLLKSETNKRPTDWSRDGRFILYENEDPKTKTDLYVYPMLGDRRPFPFLNSEFNEAQARFSPDSRWVAYVSDESGAPQVYVQAFPRGTAKYQISDAGGEEPQWRGDGKEIFYISAGKLMAVAIKATGSTLEPALPRPLFDARISRAVWNGNYAVRADGQSFLVNSLGVASASPLTVVLNWSAGLK